MTVFSAQELLRRHDIAFVETRSGKYTTKCPNCSNGYLNVKLERDRVAWFCHSCDQGSAEKYDQPEAGGELGPVKATYDYLDEHGQLLFQALRFEPVNGPKQFRQRTGPDQEKWSIKGVRIVPFKLPELIDDLALERVVFVVEGERDVLTLRAHGVPATCNPMGAGKWWPEFNAILHGADIVICGDNDEPGRKHVELVARNLAPIVKRLRVLELATIWPEIQQSDDVTDWFTSGGGTVEQLWAAIEPLPDFQPKPSGNGYGHAQNGPALAERWDMPAVDKPAALPALDIAAWDGMRVPPREWAVHNRIARRAVSLLSGEGGVGKSILILQLLAAHVLPCDWFGTLPEPGPVIYLNAEDDERELHFRLDAVRAHLGTTFAALKDLHLVPLAGEDALLGVPDRAGIIRPTPLFEQLKQTAASMKPVLIALDTAADMFGGNENDRGQVRQFIGLLRGLAITANAGVLLASHPSLSGITTDSGLSGSTGWHNSVRSRLYFKAAKATEGDKANTDLRELEVRKNNYGPSGEIIRMRWENGVFLPISTPSSIDKAAAESEAEHLFLDLLARYEKQGQTVSPHPNSPKNYAPTAFARRGDVTGTGKTAFEGAMERLLDAGTIRIETFGPPSKQRSKLVRT